MSDVILKKNIRSYLRRQRSLISAAYGKRSSNDFVRGMRTILSEIEECCHNHDQGNGFNSDDEVSALNRKREIQ